MSETILEMEGISKAYHGVPALEEVSLRIARGEVHALMGENGAGKSTLMKILTGLVKPDEGELRFDGEVVQMDSAQAALRLGIAMIHQELNPITEMTVAENIFLGREPLYRRTPFVNRRLLNKMARELLEEFRLEVDPTDKVGRLSVAQKQMLEIIKAFSYQAKLIVMDEPTSALSEEEVKTLFRTIRRLKEKGVPVIYISHRMEEIFTITDRVTVLRDGRYIGTGATSALTSETLISMMVGRSIHTIYPKTETQPGDVVLEVKGLTGQGRFRDVSFQVRSGEIVGFAGLMGAGRSEVMRAIFGIDRLDAGEVWLNGKRIHIRHPSEAVRHGMAMVTEDRKELGLVLCRPIRENLTLASLGQVSQGPFVSSRQEEQRCEELREEIRIKMARMDQEVQSLSGGNQQKVVLAKWLMLHPKLLILDEPTRGIDVGAKTEIYRLMSELAQQGMAIVMVSSELPEIMGMSDRVLVMGGGLVRGEFRKGQLTQEQILECAIGGATSA